MNIKQLSKKSKFGLVIDWKFHKQNRWVCAPTPYLIDAIIEEFDPIILSSQLEYTIHKKKLSFIISMEPGWGAPKICYDGKADCIKAMFCSDPHGRTKEKRQYFEKNGFDFVFSYYKSPFFYHFDNFPEEKFLHMPWAIPDNLISTHSLRVRNTEVAIFGGKNSDAYDMRNWCRQQNYVQDYYYSGVENKELIKKQYFVWLAQFDAVVAAGSTDPKYDLVTPKYFEIVSAGALLIGQYCKDLPELGFNESNALIFRNREEFAECVARFKKDPEFFITIREKGRDLIKTRHKVSDRINLIKKIFK